MTDSNAALHLALKHAEKHLAELPDAPVGTTVNREGILAKLDRPLRDGPTPPTQVIDELVEDVKGGLIGSAGGRFYAWVIGGGTPASLAADWLVSAWDQNAALHDTAPAAAVVEEVVGRWLKELLGLPAHASFALTTGCQMAHVTALAAARNAVLSDRGWDVEEKGLFGAPAIRVLTGAETHGTNQRALRYLGFGKAAIRSLALDPEGRLRAETLKNAFAEAPDAPTIVILQAGELNTGIFDPFEELIPIARAHHAWVHVDGAFGLWAAASKTKRSLMAGADQADSWATDAHKWLNVPYDSGIAFVARNGPHRAAVSYRASYLTHQADARDPMDWNLEWSRRARGFPIYAAIRELGRDGIAQMVDRCCEMASKLVEGLGALPNVEVLHHPNLNQGLVRFRDPKPGATEADHARRTDAVIARIDREGEAFFGGVTFRGVRAMRISVSNWRTDANDVARTIAAVKHAMG